MKVIASVGAALTFACALVVMTSPASSQIAPRAVVKTQPIGPVVTAPNAEIAAPTIPSTPRAEEEAPQVNVTWEGGLPAFEGVIESIGTKYTMFSPNGSAVRATATPNGEKQRNAPPREEESEEEPNQTP